jgi:hypothetical protein
MQSGFCNVCQTLHSTQAGCRPQQQVDLPGKKAKRGILARVLGRGPVEKEAGAGSSTPEHSDSREREQLLARAAVEQRQKLRPKGAPVSDDGPFSLSQFEQVENYVQQMLGVYEDWDKVTSEVRVTRIGKMLHDFFVACRVFPPILMEYSKLTSNAGAEFDPESWAIRIPVGLLKPAKSELDPAQFLRIMKTIYHEARHVEQWFQMARLSSENRLHLPSRIFQQANRRKVTCDDPLPAGVRAWYDSVAGGGEGKRHVCLGRFALKRKGGVVDELESWRAGTDAHDSLAEEEDAITTEDNMSAVARAALGL